VNHTVHCDSLLTPPAMTKERIRTTISLTPETHEVFKRMAEAAGLSVSKCMGDWLEDTADAAQMVARKMEEARKAPMQVMRELKAMAMGMGEMVDSDMEKLRSLKRHPPASGALGAAVALKAPSSNTGLKSPKKTKSRG
jgi:hypothetical protein